MITARTAALSPAAFAQYSTRHLSAEHEFKWRPARHLDYLSSKLMDVAAGRVKRLAVFMPPRMGKSRMLTSFVAWYLGRNPDRRVIWAANEHTLAANMGAATRDLLEHSGADVFGVGISGDSSAKDDWGIEGHNGGMLCRGIRGRLTGSGANVAVIDDPVKDPIEADSETIAEQNADWYSSVLLGRLEPGAAVVLCMQRWGINDLWARVVDDTWATVELPALARDGDPIGRQPGEPLWSERGWTREAFEAKRREIEMTKGRRWWQAQYEGNPTSAEAMGFTPEMVQLVDQPPPASECLSARAWDLSAGGTDYSGGVRIDYHPQTDLFFISDVARGRWKPDEVRAKLRATAQQDGYGTLIRIEQEPGGSGKGWYESLAQELRGYAVEPVAPTGAKRLRWEPLQAAMAVGKVWIVEAAWTEAFINELLGAGKNDDQLDAAAYAYSTLAADAARGASLRLTII